MTDVVLFGATGYTGKLTAAALHERGLNFALAGRDAEKLKELGAQVGSPEIRLADASDPRSLSDALGGAKVLITCVGPFVRYGWTAVEAALEAGVHYIDSTGEGTFIDRLLTEADPQARSKGIAMAPAMGFDEVPGDVAVALAVEGLERPVVKVTYAVPTTPSRGTAQSALGILAEGGDFIREGERVPVRAASFERWAPLPQPLGPKRSISFPLALLRLAPLHADLSTFETYVSIGSPMATLTKVGYPVIKAALGGPIGKLIKGQIKRLPEGPNDKQRQARWTILAEARSGDRWRNVVVTGKDVYGLTAQTLVTGAEAMLADGYDRTGVVSPVQAAGLDTLRDRLGRLDVTIDIYEPD